MNTIEKIIVKDNKILKLNNVLIRELAESEFMNINKIAYMMDSYAKSKGNAIVGPMINYSAAKVDESGKVKIILKLMVQLKNPIHNVEVPYEFENQIRITNCLFARFNEKEENLQFAYSKLQLHAFEKDVKLKGDSYTVFVENKDGKIVADVFMEVKKGDLDIESL
ncbi:hypothetical protein KQI89_05540 [Clostridium sp. MSJ-4]|uniref:Uncharacterized protein n=1 Tax=Clostridium simiarum TaxID=2841506 RepID=A0ABS6EYR6_9CLOT|nr:hypothetical protein [Clostridium simiarum]MBU5591221.1 hypothetical protein [Clostridium simiarum]